MKMTREANSFGNDGPAASEWEVWYTNGITYAVVCRGLGQSEAEHFARRYADHCMSIFNHLPHGDAVTVAPFEYAGKVLGWQVPHTR